MDVKSPSDSSPAPHAADVPPASSIIEVADSRFVGYVVPLRNGGASDALRVRDRLRRNVHPGAAHVAVCWSVPRRDEGDDDRRCGHDEDGEPPGSAGPAMLEEIRRELSNRDDSSWRDGDDHESSGMAVVVARYFGERLLGVTCGRLAHCYGAAARAALRAHFLGADVPTEEEYLAPKESRGKRNLYGLAAGDTELILDAVPDPHGDILERVRNELDFDAMVGADGKALPRLQNLQATMEDGDGNAAMPIYRYPGNYSGTEWETHPWRPTSRAIKRATERALLPLYGQEMNHCVTNLYRSGYDHISHHSDKDLDLNREGVIVSVSLGETRVMELKRRALPRHVVRVALPHGSMLVLGPKTNGAWTHSILPRGGQSDNGDGHGGVRISLTMRDVRTFLDKRSGRLFGQGVSTKSLDAVRWSGALEHNVSVVGSLAALSALVFTRRKDLAAWSGLSLAGLTTVAIWTYRKARLLAQRAREEREARDFFSRSSASGTRY